MNARLSFITGTFALGILMPPAALSQSIPHATLLADQSQITFVSRQMGVPVEGRFRDFQADIAFDPRQAATGKVRLSISTGSATFGIDDTDSELARPAWFNIAAFPKATFQSRSIAALGAGRFEVKGALNIKGRTQDIAVPLRLTQSGTRTTASGALVIKRLDFKIGEGEWADASLVANDVQVNFTLTLSGVPPL